MEDAPAPTLARLAVVLVATSHPGNVGASARAMLAMGLDRLVLVSPGRFPDPEATARAAGANDVLERARIVGTLDAALDGVACSIGFTARPREFAGTVLSAREAAGFAVASLRAGRKAAFVFGNEMSGLSNDELARCTAVATIAANPAMSSLNLAAAVQVMAYELRLAALDPGAPPAPENPPATAEEIRNFYAHLQAAVTQSGFLDPAHPKRLMPRLRRLFDRIHLERDEVSLLRGMLKTFMKPGNKVD